MNKKLGTLMVAGVTLLLAGCGNQVKNDAESASSSSASSLLVAKSNVKVSGDDLTPQQAVSLITTYCGNKYGGCWATVAKQSQNRGLKVNLYPADQYKLSDSGQGVAYDVTAGGTSSGAVYTVDGDNVNIYKNVKRGQKSTKVATISKDAMADYVNEQGQGKLVNDLSAKAQVVDKRNGDTGSGSTGSSSSVDNKYGRIGTINFPAEMQGTWYTADNDNDLSVKIAGNTISFSGDDGGTTKLYKQDPHFLDDESTYLNQSVQEATKDWGRGSFFNLDGARWLNVRGWTQTAGDGSSYTVKTETVNGKQVKVLVQSGGAMNFVEAVYYQSEDMAQQQADTKFDDLHYMDDDD